MKYKTSIYAILFLAGFLPTSLLAADWFVRPAGQVYGSQNGTSYANAWPGLSNVEWGADGVQAGDTLYVCGTHYEWNGLHIGASGTPEARIIINGDCPGDTGTIWAGLRIRETEWSQNESGLYYVPWTRNDTPYSAAGIPGTEVLLRIATSVEDCASLENSVFLDQTNKVLYYNPIAQPEQIMTFWGNSAIRMRSNSYITVTGSPDNHFKLRGGRCCNWGTITVANGDSGDGPATDIIVEHVDIAFSAFTGIRTGVGSHNMLVQDSVFHDVANGIYPILNAGDHPSTNGTRILRNEFFSGTPNAQHKIYGNAIADNHAIGAMSGDDIEVSENYIHDWRGMAINLYMTGDTSGYTMRRFRITRNRIENLVGEDVEYTSAILVNGSSSGDFGDRISGGIISHNVISGCPIGYPAGKYGYGGAFRIKSGESDAPIIIAQNTVQDCYFGLYHRNTSPEGQMGFSFLNNIIDQPRSGGFYYYIEASPNRKVVYLDGNLFSGHLNDSAFFYKTRTYTLPEWQATSEMNLPDIRSRALTESLLTPLMAIEKTAAEPAPLAPVPAELDYCIDPLSAWPRGVKLVPSANTSGIRLQGAICAAGTNIPIASPTGLSIIPTE